jgi:hypothetical protein
MHAALRKSAFTLAFVALVVVLVGALGSTATAAWGFYYNPQNNTAGWDLGPYKTKYQWGPGWFRSDGVGPNGLGGNYYSGPNYRGWSHWGNGKVQGSFQTPWANGGNAVYWQY